MEEYCLKKWQRSASECRGKAISSCKERIVEMADQKHKEGKFQSDPGISQFIHPSEP